MVVSRQREALKEIQRLKRATTVSLSRRMNISTDYARYLCSSLASRGYIEGTPLGGYQLTPQGEAEVERQKQIDIFRR